MDAIDPAFSPRSPIVESNVTKPRILRNGGIGSVGSWKKRLLENTGDPYSGDNPKFKRAKVSANRDFPKGCGRFAVTVGDKPSLDNVVVDTAEILAIGADCVASLQPETLETLKITVESELPESLINADQNEQMGLARSVDRHESVGFSKSSDHSESTELLKSSDLPNSDQPEMVELIKNSQIEVGEPFKVSDQHKVNLQVSVLSVEATGEVVEEKNVPLPRRRVSAVRDFPYGAGRNSPRLVREEILKFAASSIDGNYDGGKSLGQNKPEKQAGNTLKSNKLERIESEHKGEEEAGEAVKAVKLEKVESEHKGNNTKDIVEKVQVRAPSEVRTFNMPDKDPPAPCIKLVEAPAGKVVTKKSVKSIKVKTSLGPVEPGGGNADMDEPQGVDFHNVDVFSNKVIVQPLVAEPYCPWKQGNQMPKIKPMRSPLDKDESKANKEDKLIGKMVKLNDKFVTRKKRSQLMGRAPSMVKNRMAFKNMAFNNKEDSLPQQGTNLFSVLKGEEENLPDYDASTTSAPNSRGLRNLHSKGESNETVTRNKVRETLRLFQVIFRKLLQEEETTKQKEKTRRIDLAVYNLLKEKNKWVNTGKQILGIVPGVEIGDEFHYRVELCIVGLHRLIQGGIDFVKQGNRILATSIVASDGADDMDSSDVLVYSGSGGNPAQKGKKPEDQKLERGNLALKNSIDSKTHVRVIRGFKEFKNDAQDTRGKCISTYTYDGLYLVEKYWIERGPYDFSVYKFQLRRMAGQPELAWKIVKQARKSKKSAPREGLCVDDISQGLEKMPICAVNTIDNDQPPPFRYITKMIYPDWYEPTSPRGCDCSNGCSDSHNCACAVKNGGEIPFNHNGDIVEAKPLVYECGPSCKCPPTCHNRVSQHGIKFQLEIFKTESRGWGVRSLTSIPSGSFICEYTGELLRDTEAEQRINDEYLFDIGKNYNDRSLWDGLSTLIPDLQLSAACDVVENVGFTIDAAEYGSVGRFINHSCSPNLYAQNLLYDHDDKRMPHIMLFAAENIPPLQELTYHYNYTVDQVHDSDGNIKRKNCYCGSHECTGRLY